MPPISSAFFNTSSTRAAGMTTTPSMSPNIQSPESTRRWREVVPETAIGFSIARIRRAPFRFDRRHVAREDRPVGNVEEEIAVAHAAVDDDAGRAARLGGGRHQLAPVPGLPIAGGRHQHHAARIHALEEIEGRDLGKVGVFGVAARIGGGGDGEGRTGDPHRPVDRLDREVEALMRQPHLVHDVVDGGGIKLLQPRRGLCDLCRGSAPPIPPPDADF